MKPYHAKEKFGNRYTLSLLRFFNVRCNYSSYFTLQVVMGEYYREQSENRLVRSMPIKAPRRNTDRQWRPLITNRQGFSIIFYKEYKAGELESLISGCDGLRFTVFLILIHFRLQKNIL